MMPTTCTPVWVLNKRRKDLRIKDPTYSQPSRRAEDPNRGLITNENPADIGPTLPSRLINTQIGGPLSGGNPDIDLRSSKDRF
jgi:hypothetical protein